MPDPTGPGSFTCSSVPLEDARGGRRRALGAGQRWSRSARTPGANVCRERLAWIGHAHLRQEGRPGLAASCRVEWPDRWL